MCFLTFWGGVFGRGGVGFPLASAHAGAKADVEKLQKSIGFYSVICLCALCARVAQTKGRERTTTKTSNPTTQEKMHAADTPKIAPKTSFPAPGAGVQKSAEKGPFSWWRNHWFYDAKRMVFCDCLESERAKGALLGQRFIEGKWTLPIN